MEKKENIGDVVKENNHITCPKCGGRCCSDTEIYPSPFLKCEKCGQLVEDPNYPVGFIGCH